MNSVVPRDVAYKSSVDFKNPVLLQKFDRLFRTQTVTKKQATLMIAGILYNLWNLKLRKHQKQSKSDYTICFCNHKTNSNIHTKLRFHVI